MPNYRNGKLGQYLRLAAAVTPVLLALGFVMPASASPPTGFECDGQGGGSCASLPNGGSVFSGENVIVLGANNGAWQWDRVSQPSVVNDGSWIGSHYTGDPQYRFKLHFNPNYCMANSGGAVLLLMCDGSASQLWVVTNSGRTLNVGRSNDKDDAEELTNDNGGICYVEQQGAQTDYHQEWAFVLPGS